MSFRFIWMKKWYRLRVLPGRFDEDDPIDVLDVTISSRLILDKILGIKDLRRDKRIDFVGGLRGLDELKRRCDSGEMKMALALYPVSMQQIMDIADCGKIMPPKATWFEPKLRSGLVIQTVVRKKSIFLQLRLPVESGSRSFLNSRDMEGNDVYKTITAPAEGEYSEKRSKFLAFIHPVHTIDEVKEQVEHYQKRSYDARHCCYAYMLGHERKDFRANDNGEPSGTAGKPILGQINSYGLTDVLIVVIRYFGGIKLGTSGLIQPIRQQPSKPYRRPGL